MHLPSSGTSWKRRFAPALVLGAVALVLAATPASAQDWVGNTVGVGLAGIFGWVLSLLISVVGHLMIVVTKIFIWAVAYSDFIYNGTVTIGWEIVRDLSNMFFVVAILAIAWATILQLESYGYRRLLAKLLLMAVLVNFSKFIAGVVIDIGQIIILTFAQAAVGGISASSLYIKLGVGDLVGFSSRITEADAAGQAFELVGTLLFGFILLVIAFSVILAYTLIFTFRIVALWILIILSPLAFLLAAIPAGQGYSRQWWSSFTKYVFTGVIIMFFFWLALVTSQSAFTILDPELVKEEQEKLLTVAGSKMGSPINLSRFIITVSFLIAGLVAAQKAGVAGSSFAGDVLQRLRRAPGQLGRFAYRSTRDTSAWAARKIKAGELPTVGFGKYKVNLGKYTRGLDLNVMNWARGFKESREEKKHREEALGKFYSGEALHKGGWAGTFKGLGSGRDFFDAYAKGIFNIQGFKRLGGALAGGEDSTHKIFKEVELEKGKQKALEAERDQLLRRANKKDNLEEGAEEWVIQNLTAQTGRVVADRTSGTAAADKLNKQYRKEYVRSIGVDDDKERDRLAELDPGDAEYSSWFDNRWDKFVGERDKEVATKQLQAQAQAIRNDPRHADRARMNAMGERAAKDNLLNKKEELDRLAAGHRTVAEVAKDQSTADKLVDELKRVDADITNAILSGKNHSTLDAEKARILGELGKIAVETTPGKWDAKWEVTDLRERAERKNKYKTHDPDKGETFADSLFAKAEGALEEAKFMVQAPKRTDDERQGLLDRVRVLDRQVEDGKKRQAGLKEQATKAEAPKAFYADEGYQGLIREQMGKITGQNSEELTAAFRSALRDGDRIKASAIAMKLARDSNDNELWNEFGFDSNSEGKHAFFDAVMMGNKGVKMGDGTTAYTGSSFNMSEQEAYSLENAIDYINEDVNHWETARTMKMEGGLFKRMKSEEHALAALAEIMKKNPREVARNFNRLAYGGERVTDRTTGAREFTPTALGKAIALQLGPEILTNMGRGEFNKNAALHMGTWMEKAGGAAELERIQVDERFMRKLAALYRTENVRGTTGAVDTIRKLFQGLI